jgi:hypothetical protein
MSHSTVHGAFSQECSCGRVFAQPGAFKNHQNACQSNKKALADVLAKTKHVLAARKAKKVATLRARGAIDSESSGAPIDTQLSSHPEVRGPNLLYCISALRR